MFYNVSNYPERWADVLISSNEQKRVQIDSRCLSDQTILEISQEIVEKNLPSDLPILNKIKQGFENFLALQQTKKKHAESKVNFFSARFSRWAQNHSTLTKILIVVSFGFFKKILKEGQQINKQNLDLQKQITQFTAFSEIVLKKIEKVLQAQVLQQLEKVPPKVEVPPQPYPKEILEIIFQYLNLDEKNDLLRWEKAREMMQKADDEYKYPLLHAWQKRLKEVLQPTDEFKKELERVDNLGKRLNREPHFKDIIQDKKKIIEREIFNIFISNFNKTKKIVMEHRDLTLLAINQRNWHLVKESKWLQDRDFIKEALKNFNFLGQMPKEFKEDKELISIAVHYHPEYIRQVSDKSVELVEKALTFDGTLSSDKDIFLDDYSDEVKAKLVLAAVSTDISAIQRLPSHFFEDVPFLLKVQKLNVHVFKYLSEDLQNNKEIINAALDSDPAVLAYLPYYFRSQPELIMKAVKQNGATLQYASEKLRKDPNICLAAVNSSIEAINHVLYIDKQIVLSALQWDTSRNTEVQNSLLEWIKKLPPAFFEDFDVMLEVVSFFGLYLELASPSLKNNPAIVLKAVQNTSEALDTASQELQNDKAFLLKAIQANPCCYQNINDSFRNDPTLTLAAIDTPNPTSNWYCVPAELKKDPEILAAYQKWLYVQ